MSLILKQETASSVPTPPAGKGTIFLNNSDQVVVKDSAGNSSIFPSVTGTSNTQIIYNDQDTFSGSNAFVFDNTSNTVTVSNLTVTNTLIAGDIAVSSIANGTSNVDIVGVSGNITISVAGNANILTATGTGVNVAGTLNATGNANVGNIGATGAVFTTIAGSLTTASQSNITSVGTLTSLLVGSTANFTDFPNAKAVLSQDNTGQTHSENIGVVGEAVADSGNTSTWGIGVLGEARANGDTKGTGVQGGGYVTNTSDTGAAVGVRGYSISTHAGGYNIGVLGNAAGSGLGNYAFYVQSGDIASIETATNWDLADDEAVAISFRSSGKANIFGIETTDGAEGIFTEGYLNVTGNIVSGGIKTDNYYYANGSPVDFQQTAGSNTYVQYNNNGDFGASADFTFNSATNTLSASNIAGTLTTASQPNITTVGTLGNLSVTSNISAGDLNISGATVVTGNMSAGNISTGGTLSATGNANVGNLGTGGLITATGNITGGNLTTSGVVSATGNVSGGNLTTAGALSVTGNANVGNIGAAAGVFTTVTGSLTTGSQPNVTSVGTLTSLAVTGTTTSGNVYANSGTVGASLLTGTLTTAEQPNVTSLGTLSTLGVNGTVTAVAFTANTGIFTGNGAGLTNLAGGNVTGQVGNALVAGTVYTAAQPNITSVGTLTSLAVSGNVTAGNVTGANLVSANFVTGTLTTAAQPNITSVGTLTSAAVTGNVTAGNVYANSGTIGASLLTGTLTTAAQPNITSVGTLSSLSVTGNITGGNLSTGGTLSVTGNANVGNIGAAAGVFTGNVSANNLSTTNKVTAGNGLQVSSGTLTVTNGNLDVTGNINVTGNLNYSNVTDLVVGDPLIYIGANNTGDTVDLGIVGSYNNGTYYHTGLARNSTNDYWTFFDGVIAEPTTVIDWANATYPTVKLGNLITTSGANIAGVLTVTGNASAGNISTAGVLSVTGNANVGNIGAAAGVFTSVSGNGSALTALNASNISTGTLAQARLANSTLTLGNTTLTLGGTTTTVAGLSSVTSTTFVGALTGAATTAGTVTTAAQPNITSVGTLTSLAVTGNISAGNVSATTFTGALSGAATTAGTVTTNAQPNITSVGTLTSLAVTGNISAGNVSATTFTGALSGAATTAGTVTTNAQPNITSVGTLSSLTVSGNVSTGNISGTLVTGTLATAAQPNITSVGTLTSLSVTGNISAGNVSATTFTGALSGAATTAGTVTTAAQPNITSVGTLSSLTASGSITSTAATCLTTSLSGTNSANLIYASMGDNDQFRILVGATATNAGYVEIATADDGTEPIYVRQYTGVFSSLARTATLLDGSGNTSFPGSVTAGGFVQTTTLTTGANSTAGTVTGNWTLSAGSKWNATYADLAEKYTADAEYDSGTVLIFGGEQEVTISTEDNTTRVAGVVTTDPAFSMNAECEGEFVAEIALQGRVPCKVIGPVYKGDLLVAGIDGHAIANNAARAGTIIGKSLGVFTGDRGVIEVAVGRF